jgi:DNA-binding MarR family transcriptional regulator
MPARVIGAENLSALDLRVMMAIAVHDRLGANGIGCSASQTRLATLVDCHIKSLSRSIAALADAGMIRVKPHPLDSRQRTYQVVYSEFDQAYFDAAKGKKGNRSATYFDKVGNPEAPEKAEIGNKPGGIIEADQGVVDQNILGKTSNTSRETRGIHPAEAASSRPRHEALEMETPRGVGAILAMVERSMKAKPETFDARRWYQYLDNLVSKMDAAPAGDPDYGRASRLLEEVGALLHDGVVG